MFLFVLRLYGLIADAVEFHTRHANDVGDGRLATALDAGTLAVDLTRYPGEGWHAQFRDLDEVCWDDCDGILARHRAGWCRTNPEHADLDCGCGWDWEAEAWHDEEVSV